MNKLIEQAEANLAAAKAALIDEQRQDSAKTEGSGSQESRRENLLKRRQDEVSSCERALEEARNLRLPSTSP